MMSYIKECVFQMTEAAFTSPYIGAMSCFEPMAKREYKGGRDPVYRVEEKQPIVRLRN
jgi:hypothetical protein